VTAEVIRAFGDACRDTAVARDGPLPGAWAKAALPVLERRLRDGRFALAHAYDELDVATVEVDPALTVDADTPEELAHLLAR
jgi:hypothetical protein